MRKRIYTRNIGILLTEDSYQQLTDTTDRLEVPISEFIRDLITIKLKENKKEN